MCARCGADTHRQRGAYQRLASWKQRRSYWIHNALMPLRKLAMQKYGIPYGRLSTDWWDMDHVVPLSEGGSRDLENLRTLCIPCHRGETRELAARRASRRRGQLELNA